MIVADKRSELIPDVPTTDEQGLHRHQFQCALHGVCAGSDAEAGDRASVGRAAQGGRRPALKQRFAAIGFEPTPSSSEDMAAIMRKTAEDWIPVIKQLNIKLD